MKILISLFVLLAWAPLRAQTQYPPYVVDFMQNVLRPQLPDVDKVNGRSPYRVQYEAGKAGGQIKIEVLVPNESKKASEWNIYSTYNIHFEAAEFQTPEPPFIKIHRLQSPKGDYLGPAVEGEMRVMFNGEQLAGTQGVLEGLVRGLFRADQTLHPLFKNPLARSQPQGKKLTVPQLEAIFGKQETGEERKGLLNFYTEHQAAQSGEPMHAAVVLPTGKGKTIIALKYLEMLSQMTSQPLPHVVFVVENRGILRDFAVKIQEFFPDVAVARLFGNSANMEIADDTRVIAVTRSTFFRRKNEILAHIGRQTGGKVIFRDEAHHTGKVGGQFDQILKEIMQGFSHDTQVIDLSATLWHEDDFRLLRKYEGRVGTSFVTPQEYELLVSGENVDRIARIQLVRAMLQGWLNPLSSLTFMTGKTKDSEGRTFRQRLIQEQRNLNEQIGFEGGEISQRTLEDLTAKEVEALREQIKQVHEPIVDELFSDLKAQFLRDRSGKIAEYDRGIITVPTTEHADIYQILLTERAKGQNMEFRVVHSKQKSNGRVDVVGENIDWLNSEERPFQHRYVIHVKILAQGVDIPSANRLVYATFSESIKELLQSLGRGTRLSPLKSGIRLTDMGGSYLKFFQEIPGSLLRSLFPVYDHVSEQSGNYANFGKTTPASRLIQMDGEALSVDELERIQVVDPMEELSRTRDRDKKQLRTDEVSSETLTSVDLMAKHAERYDWSLKVEVPQDPDVHFWIESFLKSQHEIDLAGNARIHSWDGPRYLYRQLLEVGVSTNGVSSAEADLLYKQLRANVSKGSREEKEGQNSSALPADQFLRYVLGALGHDVPALVDSYEERGAETALPGKHGYDNEVGLELNKALHQLSHEIQGREKFMKFIYANWRWMSLPWQYLLDDILVEKDFYAKGQHPLLKTYKYLMSGDNLDQLKESGFHTVLDALMAGETDFLPAELAEPVQEALLEDRAVEQLEARVGILSMLASEKGRSLLLSSPLSSRLAEVLSQQVTVQDLHPYIYPESGRNEIWGRKQGEGSRGPWISDFRYGLSEPRAGEIFNNLELAEPVKELRRKSLMVAQPYSGLERRENLNLLRLASMARQFSGASDSERALLTQFAQPNLLNDGRLGGHREAGVLGVTDGLFPVFRSERRASEVRQIPSRVAQIEGEVVDRKNPWKKTDLSYFSQSNLDDIETRHWVNALLVEGARSGQVSPDVIEEQMERHSTGRMSVEGQSLPPLLLKDVLAQAKPNIVDGTSVSDGFRLFAIQSIRDRGRNFSVSDGPITDFYLSGRYSRRLWTAQHQAKIPELDNQSSLWMDYMERVILNPNLEVLNYEQKMKVADIIEQGLPSFQSEHVPFSIPPHWMEQTEVLLKVLPKEDLPFSLESRSAYRTSGLFGSTRFFMAVPYYYSAILGGDLVRMQGIGKVGAKELTAWADHFGQKYQKELEALKFEDFVEIPKKILETAYRYHQGYKEPSAILVERLKGEGYSDEAITKAQQLLKVVNIVHPYKARKSFEFFRTEVYTSFFYKFFDARVGRDVISPWTLLVNHLTQWELDDTVQHIRNDPGSILARQRTLLGAETVEGTKNPQQEVKASSANRDALSCKKLF